MTDQELIEGLLAGHGSHSYEVAAKQIITVYAPKVLGYVMKNSGDTDDGWDIFQITFMTVLAKIEAGNYDERGKFGNFFMIVARNKWLDELRRRGTQQGRQVEMPRDIADDDDDNAHNDISMEEYSDEFIKDRNGQLLPKEKLLPLLEKWDKTDCKELLYAFHITDMGSLELANLYNVSDGTMRQRLSRCRERFRRFVAREMR